MITRREARSIIRKAVKRVPEGEEIRHLNIMPMMDIMTILLVAFLFQAAQAAAFAIGDVQLPSSKSFEPPPEGAITVTIASSAILVEGRPIVSVKNGDVDTSDKKDGALGIIVPKLTNFLAAERIDRENKMRASGKVPDRQPELMVIADKTTPFRLLFQVIMSSKTDDAGYRKFRLIVLQDEG